MSVTAFSFAGFRGRLRRPKHIGLWLLVALGLSLPALPFVPFSFLGSANLAASYALVAIALVVLTGWVGQISLGHAAFVGVGAYSTGWAATVLKLPFPVSAPLAGFFGAAIALLLGAVALRVRGLYLAVATLIFSWMADAYLFRQPWLTKYFSLPDRRLGGEGELPSFDLSSRRTVYYLAWGLVVLGILLAANLRDSKTGRSFFAVRGSEVAAAALGIDVIRVKLLAFGVSGFIAGLAGSVIMGDARVVSADQFSFNASLFYLAVAVVGGISSLPGALASAVVFASLTELFFRVEALGGYLEVVSATLLVVVLLLHRGGLAALAREGMDRIPALRRPRTPPVGSPEPMVEQPTSTNGSAPHPASAPGPVVAAPPARARRRREAAPAVVPRDEKPEVVRAESITVRFGGLTAVNNVNLAVRQGEIVGLIGPNGAGKTVTFNSLAGLVTPTEGSVHLYGRDVTSVPVHLRARMGVARTFQVIQLFPQLSVFENLLVATHVHNSAGFVGHVFVTERAVEEERKAAARVNEVMDRMGLHDMRDRRVGDLPFGVLRLVEVARALVTGFRFIMLDEPASGLDNRETDGLVEVLRELHADGMTILLIEHDVKMVTSVSDYIYVLDRGTLICEGPPEVVARDPAVIKAYIGQSLEAEPVS